MFRNIFSHIEGITILPIIGMIIFLAMFILVVIYVIRLDKKVEETWAEMPLDEIKKSEIKL
jgi:uncharacterized protein YoxC